MDFAIPEGLVAATIAGIGTAIVWAIRIVAQKHVSFVDTLEATQREIVAVTQKHATFIDNTAETQRETLAVVKTMANEIGVAKELDRFRRALAKASPMSMFCDDCGGWFGPREGARAGYTLCTCREERPQA